MGNKFKIGDRVRVVGHSKSWDGTCGAVSKLPNGDWPWYHIIDERKHLIAFEEAELELENSKENTMQTEPLMIGEYKVTILDNLTIQVGCQKVTAETINKIREMMFAWKPEPKFVVGKYVVVKDETHCRHRQRGKIVFLKKDVLEKFGRHPIIVEFADFDKNALNREIPELKISMNHLNAFQESQLTIIE